MTDNYIFELSSNVTRKSVLYKNRFGINISADLYIPTNFEREFVALTFDPSYNGYSGGVFLHLIYLLKISVQLLIILVLVHS